VRIDLHVHTAYSADSKISIRQLLKWFSKQTSLDGIAITDHDSIEGYRQLKKSGINNDDFLIIPGIEISYPQGHILVLDITEEPSKLMITTEEVIDFAKEQGGLIIIAHPYRFNGLRDSAENFPGDAIEILNPTASKEENRSAKLLAQSRNLPGIAGSDAHRIEDIGRVFNNIQTSNKVGDVTKAIKEGKVEINSGLFE
jgi:predicted metal-dependent phosphoesterase TrpH